MKTPVAFIIFKRPDTTQAVFEMIRQAKPSKLLVIADGPRKDKPREAEQCATTRAIIDQVDWDCEVLTNYSDVNQGCKQRVSSGLDWVFNTVEEAIILEDDCLPDFTFFRFCEELLNEYRHDERIMMISGSNYSVEWKSAIQSYHFSFGNSIWGWASWRRAWQHYDVKMKLWFDLENKSKVRDITADEIVYHYKSRGFDLAALGKDDDWAFAWDLAKLLQSGLTIFPSANLISNLGVDYTSRADEEAKLKVGFQPKISDLPLASMAFPLRKPNCVVVDKEYDRLRILKACGVPRKKLLLKLAANYFKELMSLSQHQ